MQQICSEKNYFDKIPPRASIDNKHPADQKMLDRLHQIGNTDEEVRQSGDASSAA